jgi:hypothetical protein
MASNPVTDMAVYLCFLCLYKKPFYRPIPHPRGHNRYLQRRFRKLQNNFPWGPWLVALLNRTGVFVLQAGPVWRGIVAACYNTNKMLRLT